MCFLSSGGWMSCFTVTEMFSSLYFSHERAAGRLLKPCVTLLTFPGVFTVDNLSVQTQTLIESTVVTGLLASDLKPEREQLFLYVCVTEVGGHRDELLSLLTQSSLLLVSPLATVPQVRLFFLRWDTGSPSEPEAACGRTKCSERCTVLHHVAPCYTRVSCYGHMLAPVDRFRAPRVRLTGFI